MRVFEYGSGGSTIYFANHSNNVVTIEHDPTWANRVLGFLTKSSLSNVEMTVKLPQLLKSPIFDPSNPFEYRSNSPEYINYSFEAYVKAIESFPNNLFDIILIDGRARPSCFMHSLSKVKLNGIIIFDNSDRSYYKHSLAFAKDQFHRIDFQGPALFLKKFTSTTVFIKYTTNNELSS